MAIVPLNTFFNLPRFFDFDDDLLSTNHHHLYPKIDMEDKENEIVLHAEVPGYNQKDVKVRVHDNKIVLSGKKDSTKEEKKEDRKYYYKEIFKSEFYRVITLPTKIDKEKVTAKIDNGILIVNLPKLNKSDDKAVEVDIK